MLLLTGGEVDVGTPAKLLHGQTPKIVLDKGVMIKNDNKPEPRACIDRFVTLMQGGAYMDKAWKEL